jgi:hypothetical protein
MWKAGTAGVSINCKLRASYGGPLYRRFERCSQRIQCGIEEMKPISKKRIIEAMGRLREGECLVFKISESFGVRFTSIQLNPKHPQERERKYLLRWGKDEEAVRNGRPLIASDEARYLADWLSERSPVLVEPSSESKQTLAA